VRSEIHFSNFITMHSV